MTEQEQAIRDLEVFGPPANGRPVGVVIAKTEPAEEPAEEPTEEPTEELEDVWAAWTSDESNLL